MIKFPKQISPESFEFTSTDPLTEFSNKLEDLASRSRALSVSPNLFVKLLPGNEFTVTVKLGKSPLNSALFGFGTSVILKGYYFKSNLNATQVNLQVVPHYMFRVFFLILPIFFMVILFTNIPVGRKFPEFYDLVFFIMIVAPILLLFTCELSKRRLLNRFVKYMELTKIA